MKYLKRFNESQDKEEFYKDLADKLFYEVNEYFVEEKGRFLPIKVMLSKNSDGNYDGSLCLGPGWSGRMNDEEEDWLFDLIRTFRDEHGINFGICADSFGVGYFYERKNMSWDEGKNFNNLPEFPFRDRID